MLASRPLAEKRHMSAAASPAAGRGRGTGFPASEQELVAVEKTPSAATFRSTSAVGRETPAVVGSTTTMSFVEAEGAALASEMTSSEALSAMTGAVHSVTELHVVMRAVPAINKTEPGPGVDAAKLPPSTRRVKPLAAPA